MRLTRLCAITLAFSGVLLAQDLKITTVTHTATKYEGTQNGRDDQNALRTQGTRTETTYVHGQLRRFEFVDVPPNQYGLTHAAIIENCESRQQFTLDLDNREVRETMLQSDEEMRTSSAARIADRAKDASQLKMQSESTTVDTGETARLLGYTAHHYRTTTRKIPIGEVPRLLGTNIESTVDAWHVDTKIEVPARGCYPKDVWENELKAIRAQTLQERHTGPSPQGPVVKFKSVVRTGLQLPTGQTIVSTESTERTVTELSEAPLDSAVFEVPAGFKRVQSLRDTGVKAKQ